MTAGFVGFESVTLSGVTWVPIVTAPASGKQRQILSVLVENPDTMDHTYQGRKVKGGTPYAHQKVFVPAGRCGQLLDGSVVLDATDESYEVSYEAAATTT